MKNATCNECNARVSSCNAVAFLFYKNQTNGYATSRVKPMETTSTDLIKEIPTNADPMTQDFSTQVGTFALPLKIVDDAGFTHTESKEEEEEQSEYELEHSDIEQSGFLWATELMREQSTLSAGVDATNYAHSESNSEHTLVPKICHFTGVTHPEICCTICSSVTQLHAVYPTDSDTYLVVATFGMNTKQVVRTVFWDLQQLRDELSPKQFRIVQRAMQRTPFFFSDL